MIKWKPRKLKKFNELSERERVRERESKGERVRRERVRAKEWGRGRKVKQKRDDEKAANISITSHPPSRALLTHAQDLNSFWFFIVQPNIGNVFIIFFFIVESNVSYNFNRFIFDDNIILTILGSSKKHNCNYNDELIGSQDGKLGGPPF